MSLLKRGQAFIDIASFGIFGEIFKLTNDDMFISTQFIYHITCATVHIGPVTVNDEKSLRIIENQSKLIIKLFLI